MYVVFQLNLIYRNFSEIVYIPNTPTSLYEDGTWTDPNWVEEDGINPELDEDDPSLVVLNAGPNDKDRDEGGFDLRSACK